MCITCVTDFPYTKPIENVIKITMGTRKLHPAVPIVIFSKIHIRVLWENLLHRRVRRYFSILRYGIGFGGKLFFIKLKDKIHGWGQRKGAETQLGSLVAIVDFQKYKKGTKLLYYKFAHIYVNLHTYFLMFSWKHTSKTSKNVEKLRQCSICA